MPARLCVRIVGFVLVGGAIGFAWPGCMKAQTAQPQPITSLPKPPDSAAPAPDATAPATAPAASTPATGTPSSTASGGGAPAVPPAEVHPITSLPKPESGVSRPPAEGTMIATPAPVVVPAPPVAAQPAVAAEPAAATTTSAPALAPTPASAAAPALAPVSAAPAAAMPQPVATPARVVVTTPIAAPAPPPVEPSLAAAPLKVSTLPNAPRPEGKARPSMKPFHSYAVMVKGGFAGFGLDIATSMGNHLNLRIGGSLFSYSGSYDADGLTIDGEVKFRTGEMSLDYYPFHNSGFRISPGVTLYNGNNLNAYTFVPAGQQFNLGDGTYTSDPSDPVHGNASMTFGRHVAPSLTIGYGNMIPRNGGHFSMPFEIGVQYIGYPMIQYNLQGSACDSMGNCGPIATDPTTQANEAEELSEINSDIRLLRFYPIISLGAAWKF